MSLEEAAGEPEGLPNAEEYVDLGQKPTFEGVSSWLIRLGYARRDSARYDVLLLQVWLNRNQFALSLQGFDFYEQLMPLCDALEILTEFCIAAHAMKEADGSLRFYEKNEYKGFMRARQAELRLACGLIPMLLRRGNLGELIAETGYGFEPLECVLEFAEAESGKDWSLPGSIRIPDARRARSA